MVNCSIADCATRCQLFRQPHAQGRLLTDFDGLLLHLFALSHALEKAREERRAFRTMSADLIWAVNHISPCFGKSNRHKQRGLTILLLDF